MIHLTEIFVLCKPMCLGPKMKMTFPPQQICIHLAADDVKSHKKFYQFAGKMLKIIEQLLYINHSTTETK